MGIVVAVDVLEDFEPGVGGVLKAAALKHFGLEGAEEGFGPGIVVGVGATGHALDHASARQGGTKGVAGIL